MAFIYQNTVQFSVFASETLKDINHTFSFKQKNVYKILYFEQIL